MTRINIRRTMMSFGFGAVFTYVLLIIYSTPTIYKRRIDFIQNLVDGKLDEEQLADRHNEYVPPGIGVSGHSRQHRRDIFEAVRTVRRKKAALHEFRNRGFDASLLEKMENVKFGNDKKDTPVDNLEHEHHVEMNKPAQPYDNNFDTVKKDTPVDNLEHEHHVEMNKPAQPYDNNFDTVKKDASLDKVEQEKRGEINNPAQKYYNKEITIPKSEHYVDEPIDPHNYAYIHNPDVCTKSDGRRMKVMLVFMVTTAPRHFERRDLIRQTYGNKRNWPVWSRGAFRLVFLLGAVSDSSLQGELNAEAKRYGDVVQEDFVDSYANLTLKTVMGLKWVTNRCRHATFTMKIDDDSMIHQNRLLRLLKNATMTRFTAAEALIDAPVLHNTSSKYYISETYFPASTYPPYLNGPGYLISTDLTEGLYRAAISTPLFPWEDVFMGLCLQKLGVIPKVYHDFILIIAKESQISDKMEAAKLFRYYTVVSNLEIEYMRLMWDTCHYRLDEFS